MVLFQEPVAAEAQSFTDGRDLPVMATVGISGRVCCFPAGIHGQAFCPDMEAVTGADGHGTPHQSVEVFGGVGAQVPGDRHGHVGLRRDVQNPGCHLFGGGLTDGSLRCQKVFGNVQPADFRLFLVDDSRTGQPAGYSWQPAETRGRQSGCAAFGQHDALFAAIQNRIQRLGSFGAEWVRRRKRHG